MSFLTKIDELHDESKIIYGLKATNSDFSSFIDVEPIDISLTKKFIIRKQNKSRLLIVSGKQRVYLSDYRIISTILHMDKLYINWFLNELIDLYNDKYKSFKFSIENEEFYGLGMSYYPNPYNLLLFSDTKIDINDFIFVVNFVLFKDKQWETDSSQKNFSKKTIVKYIILIDYFANNTERSRSFLSKIGYHIEEPYQIATLKDDAFSLKINDFDISKYL